MTQLKIMRLRLENFKCHKSLTMNFNGGNASVYGDNATGKTSIYDAVTWLLFGKDSSGNGEKNIEIKPLNKAGDVADHMAVTAVEAVLQVAVDGQEPYEVTLRRTYREVWTTKRGSSQQTYDGNTSEYYVDGVPCKKNVFQDKVAELVEEETWRMLTSVNYFSAGLSWQDRRSVLFKIAGVQDDKQIMATDDRFAELSNSAGNLSLEDYKKKLLAEKRRASGVKTDIPARISECENTLGAIEGLDFKKAREEVADLTAQKEAVEAQISALDNDSAYRAKRLEVREAQIALKDLETENNAFRASQNSGVADVMAMHKRMAQLQGNLTVKTEQAKKLRATLAGYDQRVVDARSRWGTVNAETFGAGTCPTCGQNLPDDQLRKAQAAFESQKQRRLDEIVQTANAQKEAKKGVEDRIMALEIEINGLETEVSALQGELDKANAEKVEPKDMDGFAQRRQALKDTEQRLSNELAVMAEDSISLRGGLVQQKQAIKQQISAQMQILGKESVLAFTRERIEKLRKDAQEAAAQLDAIEQMLFVIDEFTRYKTRFVEATINSMFRIARFRLFREQANGGVEDRCDVVMDGVPYMCLNNGAKTNVGIDIINTLSNAYGVQVPLVVDNAESITRLEGSMSQIIRLVVSEQDKELRVQHA